MKTFNKILIFIIIILIVITIPTAIIINNELKSNKQLTSISPTSIPSTSIPPTSIPSTSIPPTSIPPTSIPSTSIPSTSIPSTSIPSTSIPSTSIPPTSIPSSSQSLNFLNSNYNNLGSKFTFLYLNKGTMIMSPQKNNVLYIDKNDGSLNLWVNVNNDNNVQKYQIFPGSATQESVFSFGGAAGCEVLICFLYGNMPIWATPNFSGISISPDVVFEITDDNNILLSYSPKYGETYWSLYNYFDKTQKINFGVSYLVYNYLKSKINFIYYNTGTRGSFKLTNNTGIISSDNQVALVIEDNSLILYVGILQQYKPYILIGSNNSSDSLLTFQSDGNLCFYQPQGSLIWSSQTSKCSGAYEFWITSSTSSLYPILYISDSNGKTLWSLNSNSLNSISNLNFGTLSC